MFRITSPVGDFFFPDDTQLSSAKLVRDTLQGQILNPPPGYFKPKTPGELRDWFNKEFEKAIGPINFVLRPKAA